VASTTTGVSGVKRKSISFEESAKSASAGPKRGNFTTNHPQVAKKRTTGHGKVYAPPQGKYSSNLDGIGKSLKVFFQKNYVSSDRGLYSVPINSPPARRQVLPPITFKIFVLGNNTCFLTFLKYVNTFNHFEMVLKKQKNTGNCEMG
jgi:hypothetical protein